MVVGAISTSFLMTKILIPRKSGTVLTLPKGITAYLEANYEVSKHLSADEAIEALDEFDPDVLVADVMMPSGISGFVLVRQALKKKPSLKVVVITGREDWKTKSTAKSLGAEYLPKPFSFSSLQSVIERLLAAAR